MNAITPITARPATSAHQRRMAHAASEAIACTIIADAAKAYALASERSAIRNDEWCQVELIRLCEAMMALTDIANLDHVIANAKHDLLREHAFDVDAGGYVDGNGDPVAGWDLGLCHPDDGCGSKAVVL